MNLNKKKQLILLKCDLLFKMAVSFGGTQKLTDVCRLCLKRSNEMSQIFDDNTKTALLADKITSIAHVQVIKSKKKKLILK